MHIAFSCRQEQGIPGCVERVCLYTPWNQPQQVQNPQNGQIVVMNPGQLAWQWLSSQGLVFPQGVSFTPAVINPQGTNPAGANNQPAIYCVQKTDQSVERAQVSAPYANPVGNGKYLTEPPVQQPKGAPRAVPQGAYEDLHDAGLAINSDPMMGEMDGAAGTFSDIDSTGTERLRQNFMPPSQSRPG